MFYTTLINFKDRLSQRTKFRSLCVWLLKSHYSQENEFSIIKMFEFSNLQLKSDLFNTENTPLSLAKFSLFP